MTEAQSEKLWYIVYTLPRAEKKLARIMNRYKIEHYLPILKMKKKWSDRFRIIDTPVFPSYIFVKINFFNEKKQILMLPGAHHFVTINYEPQTVDDIKLKAVAEMIEKYPETISLLKEQELLPGKKVKIKYGAFKGLDGIIMRVNKTKTRLVVRLPIANISAEVNLDDLGLEDMDV